MRQQSNQSSESSTSSGSRTPSPNNQFPSPGPGFLTSPQLENTDSLYVNETLNQHDEPISQTPLTNFAPIQSTPYFHKSSSMPVPLTEDLVTPNLRKQVRFSSRLINISTPSYNGCTPVPVDDDNNGPIMLSTPKRAENSTEILSSFVILSPQHDSSSTEFSGCVSSNEAPDAEAPEPDQIGNPIANKNQNSSDSRPTSSNSNPPDHSNELACHNAPAPSMKAKKLPRFQKIKPYFPCYCRVRTVVRKIKIRDVGTQTSP